MSRNPVILATISVIVTVLAVSGGLVMYGLSPSTTATSRTSSITTSGSTASMTTAVPNHGWINSSFVGSSGSRYSPIVFGADDPDNVSSLGPSVWLGKLIINSNLSQSQGEGYYGTVTIRANTFVWQSFRIASNTFFDEIDVPVAYKAAGPNITMAVYINGNMVVNASNNNGPNVGLGIEYSSDEFYLSQIYQVPAGSLVTIGFVADEAVGIFPIEGVPGNASSVANMGIPASLSDLPNNASLLPMFLMLGMADPYPMG